MTKLSDITKLSKSFCMVFVLTSAIFAKDISVSVENTANDARPAGPATFGMIFAKGDAPTALLVKNHEAQVDVKRHWPDGSIKHAVYTVNLPVIEKGGNLKLEFAPAENKDNFVPPGSAAEDLKLLDDVVVQISIHAGPQENVSLKHLIATSQPTRPMWLAGPYAREWHFKVAPADANGKGDPDLEVRFEVRYYPLVKTARISVIVENCHWLTPGNIPYDVKILSNGKDVYAKKDVGSFPHAARDDLPNNYLGHAAGARWIKRFWVAAGAGEARELGDAHIRYDLNYWNTTGLLPNYDATLKMPESALERMDKRWESAPRDILQNGFILPAFPTTGGREDIGPLPTWTARYVISQDPRALRIVLGNGDMGASCPVHNRDEKTEWTISIDDHPTYSLNPPGSKFVVKPRDTADTPWVMPSKSRFAVDSAHQPSLAYVPYLVTGDYFYLEELQFWANWNILKDNYGYRQKEKGVLSFAMQVRGVGWALRQLVHAAAISPDNFEKNRADYFTEKLNNNIQYYRDYLDGKLDFKPEPLGIFRRAVGIAYGDTEEIRKKYRTTAGWMYNFLSWSFIHIVEQGFTEAIPVRDYFCKLGIGAFIHPDEIPPFAGTAYFLPLAEQDEDGEIRIYQTWKEVAQGFEKMGVKIPTKVSSPDSGGSYSYIARGVLLEGVRAEMPGAKEALQWLETQLPNCRQALERDPTWAFTPP